MDNSVYKKGLTADDIKANGQQLIHIVLRQVINSKSYRRTSRYLGLSQLKKNFRDHKVTIMGIVTNYNVTFHHTRNESRYMTMSLLLKNVYGITAGGQMNYITDHLWLDINMMEYLHPTDKISIGDTIKAKGFVKSYHGYLGGYRHRFYFGRNYKQFHFDSNGDIYGRKWGIKATDLIKCGYPIVKDGKTVDIIPYDHGEQYLIQSLYHFTGIQFGNEFNDNYRSQLIKGAYEPCNFLSHLIKLNIRHTGISFKKKRKVRSYLTSIHKENRDDHYFLLSLDFHTMHATLRWTKHYRSSHNSAKMIIFTYNKNIKHEIKVNHLAYKSIIRHIQETLKSILWTPPYIPFIESMIISNRYYH